MRRPIRRLPSLNALRAFWAAARHGSFVAAADELFVTASAVSLQVRQLEEELSQKLFERTPRGLTLTADGAAILPGINDAFQRLQETLLEQTPGGERRQILTLSVAPSFSTKWLLPRLDRFCALYPEIDVRVHARRRKRGEPSGGAAAQLKNRLPRRTVEHADVAPVHALAEAGAERLGARLFGSVSLGVGGDAIGAPLGACPLGGGEHPHQKAFSEPLERTLDPPDVDQVSPDPDDHALSS